MRFVCWFALAACTPASLTLPAMPPVDPEVRERNLRFYCTYDQAYARGMNDARAGQDMDPSYYRQCPPDLAEQAQAGYREGYTAGVPR